MENTYIPDEERQKLANKYEDISRKLTLTEWLITGVLLILLIFSGLSNRFGIILNMSQPWASAVYFIVLAVVFGIISFPFSYYGGYVLSHRYGLSSSSLRIWLIDKAKAGMLTLVLGLLVVILVYWFMTNFPGTWWIWSSIFLIIISLLIARFTPTLIISIFFKLTPLEDTDLIEKLKRLAERANSDIVGVYTIDFSTKANTANAMLGGLGKTKRIILTDTLLKKYTHEEIEVILAHELAHQKHKDIFKLIVIQVIIAFAGFYLIDLFLRLAVTPLGFSGIEDVSALPLVILVLSIFNLIIMPVINTYSRFLEINADKTSIELTSNPHAFISAMTKLTDQNLSVAQPKKWVEVLFYDHPPYNNRVKLAYNYLNTHKGEKN